MIILASLILKNTKINALTLFPFILVRERKDFKDRVLLHHEKIHLRQQLELLVVLFYVWYVLEFYYHWFRLRNRELAYRSISFEKEAYANERDSQYLSKRTFWQFLKYR